MHVRRPLVHIAQRGGLECILELYDPGCDRSTAPIASADADIVEAVVSHAPARMADRAVRLAIEQSEAALGGSRDGPFISGHPLVKGRAVRHDGSLVRSDSCGNGVH